MISTSSLAVYREWEEEDEEDFSLSLSLSIFLDLFPSFLAGIFCFLSCRRLRSDHHSPITFVHTGFIPFFCLLLHGRALLRNVAGGSQQREEEKEGKKGEKLCRNVEKEPGAPTRARIEMSKMLLALVDRPAS